MPVSAETAHSATDVSGARSPDFMTDTKVAAFWFAEWERNRDEWLRGHHSAPAFSGDLADTPNGAHGSETNLPTSPESH